MPAPSYQYNPNGSSNNMTSYGSSSLDMASAIDSLNRLTKDQLQELLNDELKFESFIRGLDQVKSLYNEKEMLMASNKSLAEYNLSQEPRLKSAKAGFDAKKAEIRDLAAKVKSLSAEVKSKSGQYDNETLLALLQAAAAEAEETSDKTAEEFMQKKNIENMDEFLDSFIEQRKVSHLRRIKADKMKDLILNGAGASTTPIRRAPPPPVYNHPSDSAANGGLPYPIHPAAAAFPQFP